MLFKRNPALFMGACSAIINLAVGFGLPVTTQQITLINTALAAIVAFVVRANVYAPVDKEGNPIEVGK